MTSTGLATLLGVLNPSEVLLARECGAETKILPACWGGAAYLTAVRGAKFRPLHDRPGGVDPNPLATWFCAGRGPSESAVNYARGLIHAGDCAEITRRSQIRLLRSTVRANL